jgi:diadenosine tetraphosphatase ApaH/serine/threonine PP2A family protein phosphatase
VVGNTDELLWRPEEHARQLERAPALASVLSLLFEVYAPDTLSRLGEERVAWLRGLPASHRVGPGLTVVHASPGDLWRAPMPSASDDELVGAFSSVGSDEVVYGHIHRPFVRAGVGVGVGLSVGGGLTVANAGSVGMPWDGDPRAAYLLITDGVPEVIRVPYNVEAEARALRAAGHPDAERLISMRMTGSFVRPGGVSSG